MDGEIEEMLSTIFSEMGMMLLRMGVIFITCMLASKIIRTALSRDTNGTKGRTLALYTGCFLLLHALFCGWQQLDNGMFIAILYSGDFPQAAMSVAGPFLENVLISFGIGIVLVVVGFVTGSGSDY